MKKDNNGFITELNSNEIIVVGTNKNGLHYGGAAKQAYDNFGLQWLVDEGISGQTYAFPTLDENMSKLNRSALERRIALLKKCCEKNQDKAFYLTRVGCGIAGFTDDYMISIFKRFDLPSNLVMPLEWTIQI